MWLKFGWTRKQASTTSFIGTETRQALRPLLDKEGKTDRNAISVRGILLTLASCGHSRAVPLDKQWVTHYI